MSSKAVLPETTGSATIRTFQVGARTPKKGEQIGTGKVDKFTAGCESIYVFSGLKPLHRPFHSRQYCKNVTFPPCGDQTNQRTSQAFDTH